MWTILEKYYLHRKPAGVSPGAYPDNVSFVTGTVQLRDMASDATERPNSKVARVIDECDLDGWGDRLERRWLGDGSERQSLRDLAAAFNRAVLATALREAGASTTDTDVDSAYRALTDDDVSRGDTLRKERELEQVGIDVEDLRGDFVTHQAVHTYLTDYRDARLEGRSPDPAEKIETLERLEGRTIAVAESTLNGLVGAGEVSERDYELFVDLRVVCEDCGTDYALVDLIREGGCDCAA